MSFELDKTPMSLIHPFFELYQRLNPNADSKIYSQLTIDLIRHYKDEAKYPQSPLQFLMDQWQESLDIGEPDYSVYGSPYYMVEGYACWAIYSRTVLRNIRKRKTEIFGDDVSKILDIGNGIGLSTVNLRELFPDAQIFANNFEGSEQWKINEVLQKDANYTLLNEHLDGNERVDLIFASEYFEHIIDPIEHARELIQMFDPKYMIIANSFNTLGIGHFRSYYNGGQMVDQSKISRLFNKYLRDSGYELVKPPFFNNTPAVWRRKNDPRLLDIPDCLRFQKDLFEKSVGNQSLN